MNDAFFVLLASDPIIIVWMALVGACIGSFLNVVVYRWPAGKSIVHPGSYCPRCQHPVRGYDNIPIVSWLILRARCRDCHAPISARYPLVEATVSMLFVLIAALEIVPAAKNLPGHVGSTPLAEIWGIGAYHLCLLCTLLCVTLIEYDKNRVPLRLIGMILGVGLIAPTLMPGLKPVTLTGQLSFTTPTGPATALAAGLVGGMAGAVLGVFAWPAAKTPGTKLPGRDGDASVHSAVLVATFLGWQAIMGIVGVGILLHAIVVAALAMAGSTKLLPWSASLAISTLGYIAMWGSVNRKLPFLVTDARGTTFISIGLGVLGISTLVWIAFLRPTRQES